MSIPIPIPKDNADEKARRVRLLRIWTDICAMALCEMPEGRSENLIFCDMSSHLGVTHFAVMAGKLVGEDFTPSFSVRASEESPSIEDDLADIQRRLKPYVA